MKKLVDDQMELIPLVRSCDRYHYTHQQACNHARNDTFQMKIENFPEFQSDDHAACIADELLRFGLITRGVLLPSPERWFDGVDGK